MGKKYVQFGSGLSCPASFDNYDASPTLRFERIPAIGRLYTKNAVRFPENTKYGDIVKGLPVTPASVSGVYCSHVLEHLTVAEFRTALRHVHSYLVPGGIFRLVMPDLQALCEEYVASSDSLRRFQLQQILFLQRKVSRTGLSGLIQDWLGHDKHCWLWDYDSTAAELVAAGFVEVRRARFGDSPDPVFNEAEERGRWEGCLGVECRKKARGA